MLDRKRAQGSCVFTLQQPFDPKFPSGQVRHNDLRAKVVMDWRSGAAVGQPSPTSGAGPAKLALIVTRERLEQGQVKV